MTFSSKLRHLTFIICGLGVIQLIEVKAESLPDRAEALKIKTQQGAETTELPQPKPIKSEIPQQTKSEGSQQVHAIDENIPDALESFYTKKLPLLAKRWPPDSIEKKWEESRPIWIRGIKTEGNSTYVGTEKQLVIHANLKRVSSLILDFEAYPDFFHELKLVRVVSKEGNRITTFWERYSPAFFIANIKYQQVYIVDANEKRVTIRYQLKSANSINFADGFLVLEAEGEATRLTAFDFFDAQWGILGGLAPGKIWHESFQNSLKDDFALKAHAEHPEWSRDQIFKESDRLLELFPVDPIQFVDPPNWGSLLSSSNK